MSEEYGSDYITLTDDEGNEFELEHLDTLEYEGETYMAFTPTLEEEPEDDEEAEIEIVILKSEEEDGEEVLVTVDDEELLEKVYGLFMQHMESNEDGPLN